MPTLPDRIEKFVTWLDGEIRQRGLTDAEVARRGGIRQSVISSARTGKLPAWNACVGIARGLTLPPETVFRAAGHLAPQLEPDAQKMELDHLYSLAGPDQRRQLLEFLRFLVESKTRSK